MLEFKEDHPRMRGEKSVAMWRRRLASGSSPHARGKEGGIDVVKAVVRIIPACAGKSCSRCS